MEKTERLKELERTLVELETRDRPANLEKIKQLERSIEEETNKYLYIKSSNQKDLDQRADREAKMLKLTAEAQFHRGLLGRDDLDKLQERKLALEEMERGYREKRRQLDGIRDELKFYDFEPTNDSLRVKVEELEGKRISFSELTFVESPSKFGISEEKSYCAPHYLLILVSQNSLLEFLARGNSMRVDTIKISKLS